MGSKLLGLVTKRDTDFVPNREAVTVDTLMTPLKDLVTAEDLGLDALWFIVNLSQRRPRGGSGGQKRGGG